MSKSTKVSDISSEDMQALNSGRMECRVLVDCLAVDFAQLARTVDGLKACDFSQISSWANQGITRRMALTAELLCERLGIDSAVTLAEHPADMVRGWAAYMIGGCDRTSLPRILESLQPLANDGHFCVREWAWLAVRPRIAQDLDEAISILSKWTASPSEYIRRFASEATRPRGVWSAHLPVLKKEPYRGLPILEPLRADVAPYVQNSVANWLNDAAKTRPDWVVELCHSWLSEKPSSATQHICKRARRSIPSK